MECIIVPIHLSLRLQIYSKPGSEFDPISEKELIINEKLHF